MAAGLSLTIETFAADAALPAPTHRLRVVATDPVGMPAAVFLYTLQPAPFRDADPRPVARFTDVCSALDLERYPEETPDPEHWPQRVRLAEVELVSPSARLLEAARADIEDAVRGLIAGLDGVDAAAAVDGTTLRLGADPA